MHLQFYSLKSCDTCKKAQKTLVSAGHTLDMIDVRADGVPVEVLENMWEIHGEALVNTRSTTWRNLPEEDRVMGVNLLQTHPTVMKRPVIVGDFSTAGWTKDVQNQWLND